MAKDVDLSSKEWRDIVFEGRNQEFGAYEMRKESDRRHNRAMIAVVIVIAAILAIVFVIDKLPKPEAKPEDQIEQSLASLAEADAEEEEQEEEQQRVEEQKPEVLPEEVLNTVKVTELAIAADNEVQEEIKSQDEIKDTQTAVGTTNFDKGTDDLNVVREHKDEIVVEEKKPVEENKVFTAVEQMPQFPGGEGELYAWISKNLRYPPMAAENNIQGRVVVQFVVTKTGTIGEVKVLRGKDPDLDKEAVRVVKALPKFIPGKMNGQAVNVWYTLPINFKLQGV
ncbi:MAG: energy transducer TonB [Bacteroidales bacterium]|nr:energy transducer TonB [Bacteroidales bacterium]MCD8394233.1 energy transducer TonB [Bacteroidales bacterium]